jgi:hypothetical protein
MVCLLCLRLDWGLSEALTNRVVATELELATLPCTDRNEFYCSLDCTESRSKVAPWAQSERADFSSRKIACRLKVNLKHRRRLPGNEAELACHLKVYGKLFGGILSAQEAHFESH